MVDLPEAHEVVSLRTHQPYRFEDKTDEGTEVLNIESQVEWMLEILRRYHRTHRIEGFPWLLLLFTSPAVG